MFPWKIWKNLVVVKSKKFLLFPVKFSKIYKIQIKMTKILIKYILYLEINTINTRLNEFKKKIDILMKMMKMMKISDVLNSLHIVLK